MPERHCLQVYTRHGCGLCDEMIEMLGPLADRLGLRLDVVDISASDELQTRFGLKVPVLYVNGEECCFGRLDEDLLEESLARA